MFAILGYIRLDDLRRTVLPNTQYVVIMEKVAAHIGSKSSICGHNGKGGGAQWFQILNIWS